MSKIISINQNWVEAGSHGALARGSSHQLAVRISYLILKFSGPTSYEKTVGSSPTRSSIYKFGRYGRVDDQTLNMRVIGKPVVRYLPRSENDANRRNAAVDR